MPEKEDCVISTEAEGKAWVVDKETNARLKVRFSMMEQNTSN
jgi:lipocalin